MPREISYPNYKIGTGGKRLSKYTASKHVQYGSQYIISPLFKEARNAEQGLDSIIVEEETAS